MDNNEFEKRLAERTDWLKKEFSGIRTGQAAPGLLDSIKVESYGSLMPLQQIGSVSVEDARTLRIAPWDASQVAAVERAINDADLGVSVATDSAGLRVIFPELTSERRQQLIKLAKQRLEEARVSVRAIRDDVMKDIDAAEKAGDISEDAKFSQKEQVQKKIDATNKELDALFAKKEGEMNA